jgi:muramoyltetrapeptide carboxypeptidase
MNRKGFLSSVVGMGAIAHASQGLAQVSPSTQLRLVPPYLKTGDTIGITTPAGYITLEEIQPAIRQITGWGLKVKIGQSIGKRDYNFGGTDEERAKDFQQMLDDPSIKAIMCARGGYGVVRIIDKLNFTNFSRNPKWIIGFSDVTILHTHLEKNYSIASIHSKMCNSFPDNWNTAEVVQKETIHSIRQALMGTTMKYSAMPSPFNRTGVTEGVLVGGNLKLIESMAGTSSDLDTNGKILFLEDTGEYLYSIDRMFWNLKRTGKLTGVKGLILGGFKIKPDDPGEEFGYPLQQIVLDKLKDYTFPVCFDFPVGHQKNNYALKCGIKHRLEVTTTSATLEEII